MTAANEDERLRHGEARSTEHRAESTEYYRVLPVVSTVVLPRLSVYRIRLLEWSSYPRTLATTMRIAPMASCLPTLIRCPRERD